MGKLLTTLDLHLLDKDFHLLEHRRRQSRSWLQHFFDLWYILVDHNTHTLAGVNDVNGAPQNLGHSGAAMSGPNLLLAAQGGGCGGLFPDPDSNAGICHKIPNDQSIEFVGDEWGIVVGSNNVAVTPQDDAMGTKIAHGTAAGELLYAGMEIIHPTFANPNGQMLLRRYFTNQSGGGVTCEEVGMYSPGYDDIVGGGIHMFCICRDLTGGVVIANTQLLVVTYTVQITV
jgi:hypothetical protein